MSSTRKFLFDTSFDPDVRPPEPKQPEPEVVAEPEPELPSFSEEELEAAREAAFREGLEQGHAQGLAEARQAAEAASAQALTLLAERVKLSLQKLDAQRDAAMVEVLESAMAVVRKLFPALSARDGLTEIEGLVRSCLERLHEEPRVVLRAPDELLDTLRGRLDELKLEAAFEGRMVLLADDTLGPGDARIEWADGGAERNGRRLWAEIDEILAHAVAASGAAAATAAPATPSESAERPTQPVS